ncbi:hypothetical protein, partial [Phormidesmis sp. 146-12]
NSLAFIISQILWFSDRPLNLRNDDGTNKEKNFCEVDESKSTRPLNFLGLHYPTIADRTQSSSRLNCKGIITETKKAGDYTFQMQVFRLPKDPKIPEKDPIATQTTETVTVKPDDEPQILSFEPTRSIYQELSVPTVLTPSPSPSPSPLPSPTTPITSPTTPLPSFLPPTPTRSPTSRTQPANAPGLIRLNWKISNWSRIEEVRLVALSPDGSIQGEPKTYSNAELSNLCPLSTESELDCQNLPTTIRKPGDYVFKLTAIVKQEQGKTELIRNTEPIKIQPRPLEIRKFTVNGETAAEKSKHTYLLSRTDDAFDISIAWEVSGGEDIKVELMPSPGVVGLVGSIPFPIAAPGSETITLKVSNKFGEQKTQSVTVQTIAPQDTPTPILLPPPPPPSGNANSNNSGKSAPPSMPDGQPDEQTGELAPIEVPPRPN